MTIYETNKLWKCLSLFRSETIFMPSTSQNGEYQDTKNYTFSICFVWVWNVFSNDERSLKELLENIRT